MDTYTSFDLRYLDSIYDAPALLTLPERLMLYALVVGIRPAVVVEIGSGFGGSAEIISAALRRNNFGHLYCIDEQPDRQIKPERWAETKGFATMIKGESPAAIDELPPAVKGNIDLAFIDGNHTYDGVMHDVEALLPLMRIGESHLLFHDASHFGVFRAIEELVERHGDLTDGGSIVSLMAREPSKDETGAPEYWAGLRLLKYQRNWL